MKKILTLLISIAMVSSFTLMSCKKKEAPVTEEVITEHPMLEEEKAVPEVEEIIPEAKEEAKEKAPGY